MSGWSGRGGHGADGLHEVVAVRQAAAVADPVQRGGGLRQHAGALARRRQHGGRQVRARHVQRHGALARPAAFQPPRALCDKSYILFMLRTH